MSQAVGVNAAFPGRYADPGRTMLADRSVGSTDRCVWWRRTMADLAYVVLTIAGFAVLALIARGLESL